MTALAGPILAFVLALVPAAPVQDVRQPSQGELMGSRLRLDNRTQVPAVQAILLEAQKEALPFVQQLMQIREEMLNLSLAGKTPELSASADRYAAAAAGMAAVEARVFARIAETLKDNQKARAVEAFGLIGGMFLPPAHEITAPSGGGRAGGDGAGRGRGGN